jgi:hypothetical protein
MGMEDEFQHQQELKGAEDYAAVFEDALLKIAEYINEKQDPELIAMFNAAIGEGYYNFRSGI